MIQELVTQNRSYRRFYGNRSVDMHALLDLVNLARLSASGRNLQPLKYIISNTVEKNEKIFATLAWAGYFNNWKPAEDERPTAYIIMLFDTNLTKIEPARDEGIACQSILLGAVEKGLGGCIIASVKKEALSKALKIPKRYQTALVIALGKPKETVVITDVKNGDIKYYRDAAGVHYVPKRALEDIVLDF